MTHKHAHVFWTSYDIIIQTVARVLAEFFAKNQASSRCIHLFDLTFAYFTNLHKRQTYSSTRGYSIPHTPPQVCPQTFSVVCLVHHVMHSSFITVNSIDIIIYTTMTSFTKNTCKVVRPKHSSMCLIVISTTV